MKGKYFLIIGKLFTSAVLLALIFLWTIIVFVFLPFAIALAMHGKKKKLSGFSLAIAMSPVAVIWTILWRLWSRDKYNEAEREFLKGFKDGHLQGNYEEGKRQGYTSVAMEESLRPKPIYDVRWGRKS